MKIPSNANDYDTMNNGTTQEPPINPDVQTGNSNTQPNTEQYPENHAVKRSGKRDHVAHEGSGKSHWSGH